jgi:hypothetical protein
MTPTIRLAKVGDTDTIVRILIASKEASFPHTVDDHDRDETFWADRWRGYIAHGSRAQKSRGDGWVFLAETDSGPVGYAAYHHTTRHDTDAELQNVYVLKEWQGRESARICSARLSIACRPTGRDGCASAMIPRARIKVSP